MPGTGTKLMPRLFSNTGDGRSAARRAGAIAAAATAAIREITARADMADTQYDLMVGSSSILRIFVLFPIFLLWLKLKNIQI
jgi:hypothetical protein